MAAKIPLHCNICPKRPKFSDVSHLLTHIASKGHLSHYYKVKVRASSDPASRALIEEYDQWYAEWNVEDLMSERMSLKDRKRGRRPLGELIGSHRLSADSLSLRKAKRERLPPSRQLAHPKQPGQQQGHKPCTLTPFLPAVSGSIGA